MTSTNEIKINVFVSSVYKELKLYRQGAIDAIWRSDLFPRAMEAEDFASPDSTLITSMAMVRTAHVYIGLFANRLGDITLKELRYAQQRGIPILIFFAETKLGPQDTEIDPERVRQLAALKDELRKNYRVAKFSTPEELERKVFNSLSELRKAGRLRVEGLEEAAEDLDIPAPPEPLYDPQYIGGSTGFFGRGAELGLIDSWVESPQPLLIIDAIGGGGKSALAWDWLQSHASTAFSARTATIWWSFYREMATVEAFLAKALAYLTGRSEEACKRLSRTKQEEELLAALRAKPVLLVLDGVERLLLAYHRRDASHLSDAEVDEQARACFDRRDGAFLRQLSSVAPTKVLVTTRLIPENLQDETNQNIQGVSLIELPGLAASDAVALFVEAGVHGDQARMRTFLAALGDHPLLIQLLAGRIRDYRYGPGDFDAWYQAIGSALELQDSDLIAKLARVLTVALEDLDQAVFHFLCRLAAFRYTIDYDALVAINPFDAGGDPEAASDALNHALTILERRGLLQWDREHNLYDLHPVVRAYAYAKLEDKETTLDQIASYFERQPEKSSDQVQEVKDLRHTFELFNALLSKGQFDSALQVYYERLRDSLIFTLGAYRTIVEQLNPLFPDGYTHLPRLSTVADQGYIANSLAVALTNLGEYSHAQALFIAQIRLRLESRDARNLATGLGNLGANFQQASQLAAAERAYQLCLAVAQAAHVQEKVDEAHDHLVSLYAVTGQCAASKLAADALMASPVKSIKTSAFTLLHLAHLRWGQGKDPQQLLDQALVRARQERFARAERDVQRLRGEVAFIRSYLHHAEEAWQAAYTIAQRQDVPLGPYLADLARLQARQGNAPIAKKLLAQAIAVGGFGVNLAAVEVHLILGEPEEARKHVIVAHREAWSDGPPYAVAHDLSRARKALKTLRMSEPQQPAFDARSVSPLPDEDTIRTFVADLVRDYYDLGQQYRAR